MQDLAMTGAFEALRPYLWLAAIAFLVGFVSYIAFGGPDAAAAHEEITRAPAEASAPVSDEWNIPKRI